jgi:hypothetical protein
MQMTLTSKGREGYDKPAAFLREGCGEITSSVRDVDGNTSFLNYGTDPDVTHLLDTKTIYLKPVNNPDRHDLCIIPLKATGVPSNLG